MSGHGEMRAITWMKKGHLIII
ncbi:hypothetical protein NC651_019638 [Populus alba x Populus x berolinensis]|nr:hypothetical protein NC651_019638 [Populus alba x Populus x berolinensis]